MENKPMNIALTEQEADRFRRLEHTRKGLDVTLRVQMERSMELYADLADDLHQFWCELADVHELPVDASLELASEDGGATFFIRERQRRRDSASDHDPSDSVSARGTND